MNIAVIITCFNRKEKTVKCIEQLLKVKDRYNSYAEDKVDLTVYLTDDGCTDGTAEAVRALCKHEELHIIQGDGQCFWAGGMRMAWREALKMKEHWHFYLLMNDDTLVMDNVFDELIVANAFSLAHFKEEGIYSGVTCSESDSNVITYGGDVYNDVTRTTTRRIQPQGKPLHADIVNANILFVSASVVEKIGIFPDCYTHACADNDYGMMANRNKIPVLVTARACGRCDNDHRSEEEECLRMVGMTLAERRKYVSNPLHSDKDYLAFIKRNIPKKYYISVLMRKLRLYFPSLYYKVNVMRGLYDKSRK